MNDSPHPEVSPTAFRRVMSRFATGVTVVTAEHAGEPRGMTANAFMSGSLEPPLCVVSVAKRAHMHEAMLSSEHFGVNILAENQVAVSDRFAGRRKGGQPLAFERHGQALLLADAAARIACRKVAAHDCGDHTIFIGHILSLEADDRAPLVYHAGRYHGLDRGIDRDVEVPEFW